MSAPKVADEGSFVDKDRGRSSPQVLLTKNIEGHPSS